jgi:PPK2 family polyphosphate:nucleotide phosphotransferase
MIEPFESPHLVPFDGEFSVGATATEPPRDAPSKKACRDRLDSLIEELYEVQRVLYADDRYAVLLLFQAMDAAGKDGTIRAVMTGVNPAGCQVFSFKQPSPEELDHDFLWRTAKRLPERGRFGIFNRSYYEEVLTVRVHPEFLDNQKLPHRPDLDRLWEDRLESIRAHEAHLARNGTVILKFWLNVSRDEQRKRFVSRIDEPSKNWKFNEGDLVERGFWDDYMTAYEAALAGTSRPWAPWYAIPADSKPYMRMAVAETIVRTLKRLPLSFPKVGEEELAVLAELRKRLKAGA